MADTFPAVLYRAEYSRVFDFAQAPFMSPDYKDLIFLKCFVLCVKKFVVFVIIVHSQEGRIWMRGMRRRIA